MKNLDDILRQATEPRPPEGYFDELSAHIKRRTTSARRRRRGSVIALRWAGAAVAAGLVAAVTIQAIMISSLMTRKDGTPEAVPAVVRLDAADVVRHTAAAREIDTYLGGRAMVVAVDGANAELQTNDGWQAARSRPMVVRFAVFKKTAGEMDLISSPTIAVLRGDDVSIRFRAKNEPLSIEYECIDMVEDARGLLLHCRVAVMSASGRTCEIKASSYLEPGSVSKLGSVTEGDSSFEVFVGYPGGAGEGTSIDVDKNRT